MRASVTTGSVREGWGSEPTPRAQEIAPPWPQPQGSLSAREGVISLPPPLPTPHHHHHSRAVSYFYHHMWQAGEKAGEPEVTPRV